MRVQSEVCLVGNQEIYRGLLQRRSGGFHAAGIHWAYISYQ